MSTPVYASESMDNNVQVIDLNNIEENLDVQVSEPMSFDEMLSYYMKQNNVSYEEALKAFPNRAKRMAGAPVSYRTLKVGLTVTSSYHPHLEFYCETSEYGNYWGILSIYSTQLVRRDSNTGASKQFGGSIDVWLRSPYQIEYVVNGDFYNNGTTTVSGGVGMNIKVNESATINCQASIATSSNFYKYFYEHRTAQYQW